LRYGYEGHLNLPFRPYSIDTSIFPYYGNAFQACNINSCKNVHTLTSLIVGKFIVVIIITLLVVVTAYH